LKQKNQKIDDVTVCLRDPNDGWMFDLAFESHAEFTVSRDARVIAAGQALDFEVLDPATALGRF
jgi:predicted nucleic acid-binding protein